jgi:hypothetical protein
MKTAVEWLIDKHFGGIESCTPDFKKHIEKAKEMEKKQQDDFAIEFTYYLSDWHTKKRVKQLLEIYKNEIKR